MENINIVVNKKSRLIKSISKRILGNDGENLQENLVFSFEDEFVNGQARLEYLLENDTGSYLVLTKVDETYQIPARSLLLQEGTIYFQLVVTEGVNDVSIPIFKSNIFKMKINDSLNTVEIEAPEGYASWLELANTKLNQMDNFDIDVSKTGSVATVTVTNRLGVEKSAQIRDGYDLDYDWDGTSLGIKREDEQEYEYVNLKGEQGIPGYTPQKGVDYYTASEKAELESEIEDYVINSSTSAFNQNATQKTNDFNSNASSKTTTFNNNATSKTSDFDSNASSKTTAFNNNATSKTGDFDSHVSGKTSDFDSHVTSKTNDFNSNASSKTTAFNNNATDKQGAYDSNATSKTTAFNDNAAAKTTAYNENHTAKLEAYNDNADDKIDEFDEHAEELQDEVDYWKTTYNSMAKVTGTGTSITLDDTGNSPMEMELKPSELSQDSDPSPSNPQDIHVVTGDNEVKIGDNILTNVEFEQGAIGYDVGSTYAQLKSSNETRIRTKNLIALDRNKNYTIKCINNNYDFIIQSFDNNQLEYYTEAGNNWITTGELAFTNIPYIAIAVRKKDSSNITPNEINNVNLQMPSKIQTFPLTLGNLEYCKIGDYEDEFMIPSGENLFAKTQWTSLTVEGNTRWGYKLQTVENDFYIFKYITNSANNINFYLYKYNNSTATIVNLISSTPQLITNDGSEYYILDLSTSVETTAKPHYDGVEFMVSYNYITEYEPYNDGKWYLKKKIGKSIFDGSNDEEWGYLLWENYNRVYISVPLAKIYTVNNNNGQLSNNFNYSTSSVLTPGETHTIGTFAQNKNTTNFYFIVEQTSASDFKTWLSTHNTIVDYILATPTYTLLNDTLQAQLTAIYKRVLSYQGQTNISQTNDDLPFVINASACYDLNKLVERVATLETE